MKGPEAGLFTVGELARKAGVTVRTLQYYDAYGLLHPQYSERGRRLIGVVSSACSRYSF